jgi:hypothetical protein
MGGPKATRLNSAPQPTLTQPGLDLLGSIFRQSGIGAGASAMQGMGPGSSVLDRIGSIFGNPIQGGFDQFGGEATLKAYQPVFQQNLGDAIAANREQGPRFSSGQDLLGMQTSQRALQDYNAFAQNVLQQGQQTKLQAMLGQGQLQGNILQQLLSTLFTGGGMNAAPIYNMSPGIGQQLLGLAGTLGGAALGGGLGGLLGGAGGGAGAGAGGAFNRQFPYGSP